MATMFEKGQTKRYSRVSTGMSGGGEAKAKKRSKDDDKSEAAEANPYGSTKALDEATKNMKKGGMTKKYAAGGSVAGASKNRRMPRPANPRRGMADSRPRPATPTRTPKNRQMPRPANPRPAAPTRGLKKYAKGGAVKKMRSGGSCGMKSGGKVRGVGCETKGKTKGRFV